MMEAEAVEPGRRLDAPDTALELTSATGGRVVLAPGSAASIGPDGLLRLEPGATAWVEAGPLMPVSVAIDASTTLEVTAAALVHRDASGAWATMQVTGSEATLHAPQLVRQLEAGRVTTHRLSSNELRFERLAPADRPAWVPAPGLGSDFAV